MTRLMILSLLLASVSLAQDTKRIVPLTAQEAKYWKELNESIDMYESFVKLDKAEQAELQKSLLADHKIKQGPCVSVEIIDGYILYEPGVGCITWNGYNNNMNLVNPVRH